MHSWKATLSSATLCEGDSAWIDVTVVQLHGLLEEAQLGMHPWQPPALQRPGKRAKTKEQALPPSHPGSLRTCHLCTYLKHVLTVLLPCDAPPLLICLTVPEKLRRVPKACSSWA